MIRLYLSPEQCQHARSGYVEIAEPQARELHSAISAALFGAAGRTGGRPKSDAAKCGCGCGLLLARARRRHPARACSLP